MIFERYQFWQSVRSLPVVTTNRILLNLTGLGMALLVTVYFLSFSLFSPDWECAKLAFSALRCSTMLNGCFKDASFGILSDPYTCLPRIELYEIKESV